MAAKKSPTKKPPAPPVFKIEPCPPTGFEVVGCPLPPKMREDAPAEVVDSFPHSHYEVDVPFDYLLRTLDREVGYGLDLDPPFQRAHVWTEDQQRAFIEYILRGGEVSKTIIVAEADTAYTHADGGYRHDCYYLVDGKQRLQAVCRFLTNDLAVFRHPGKPEGYTYEVLGVRFTRWFAGLKWRRVKLPSYAAVLHYYIQLNAGGTPHTTDEIEKVRAMLTEIQTASTTEKPL